MINFHGSQLLTFSVHGTNERAESVILLAVGKCKIIHVNNGERPLLDDQIKGPLGQKSWTVVYELQKNDAALIALKKDMDEFKSRQDEVNSRQEQKNDVVQKQTVEPFLKNVEASILRFLDGSQSKVFTPSHIFSGKKRAAQSIYVSLLLEIGYTELYFTRMANGILDRCNLASHPADVKALDTMVDTAGEMIDAYS